MRYCFMKRPDYERLYAIVRKRFEKTKFFRAGSLDETFYTMRVFETAKRIMNLLPPKDRKKVDKEAVLVATILHDVGKSVLDERKLTNLESPARGKELKKHPALGVPIAKRILKQEGYPDAFIEKVAHLVACHAMRQHYEGKKSLELKIVQDADLISDAGLPGFIRPFLFGGQYMRGTINTIHYLMHTPNRIETSGLLNLTASKRLAHEMAKEENALIAQAATYIDSDLLDLRWTRKTEPR